MRVTIFASVRKKDRERFTEKDEMKMQHRRRRREDEKTGARRGREGKTGTEREAAVPSKTIEKERGLRTKAIDRPPPLLSGGGRETADCIEELGRPLLLTVGPAHSLLATYARWVPLVRIFRDVPSRQGTAPGTHTLSRITEMQGSRPDLTRHFSKFK